MHLKGEFPSLRSGLPFVKAGPVNFVAALTQKDPDARPDFERILGGLEKLAEGKDPGIAPEAGSKGIAAPPPAQVEAAAALECMGAPRRYPPRLGAERPAARIRGSRGDGGDCSAAARRGKPELAGRSCGRRARRPTRARGS